MKIFVVFGEHFPLTFVHQNVHCLHDERERRVARQRPAESWNRTEEAPTSTSSASASLWEREARDGRKWGDVETKGPSGAGARKGVMWNGVPRKGAR